MPATAPPNTHANTITLIAMELMVYLSLKAIRGMRLFQPTEDLDP
jgi:hypothetical protein